MEAATLWKWVRRIVRYWVAFIMLVWLTSALMLLYLMHAPASSTPASLSYPASASGPTSNGPYRLHALMIASTTTIHSNMRAILNNTRATSDTLFRYPSPLYHLTSPVAEAVDGAVSVLEGVVDGVCMVMRELADEWLVQTVEMMEELRERQNNPNNPSTRSLPWQQQQLDVGGDGRASAAAGQQQHKQHHRQQAAEGGKQAGGESGAAPSGSRQGNAPRSSRPTAASSRPSLSITAPIETTHRSVLPDGSVLFLSPLPSDAAAFSLESVAAMSEGVDGEQRVALSLKDGLVRVTRKGHRDDRSELIRQLRAEDNAGVGAATAA